jgi:hypothetical protein
MVVREYSRDELKSLFSSGLSDLVRDEEVKVHIVEILDGFVYERNLPIEQTIADSVIVNDLFEQGDYKALVLYGDAQLFMCGMFPEYLSKQRRHSMGIGFYVSKGIDSYNYALYLATSKNIKNAKVTLVSKLSDSFKNNVNALIELRTRLHDKELLIDGILYEELKETVGYKGKHPILRIFQGFAYENVKDKLTDSEIRKRIEESNLKIIN